MAITNGQKTDANDFISSSAGAADEGKCPKLNSEGKLDSSFIKSGVVQFANTVVFNSTAPTTWTDLDLSGTIGSNQAIVMLEIDGQNGFRFRTNGKSNEPSWANLSDGDGGVVSVRSSSSTFTSMTAIVKTDSNGVIEWISTPGSATTITLIAYFL